MKYINPNRHRDQHAPAGNTAGYRVFSILALFVGMQLVSAGCTNDGGGEGNTSSAGQGYGGASGQGASASGPVASGAGGQNETVGGSISVNGESGTNIAAVAGGSAGPITGGTESGTGGDIAGIGGDIAGTEGGASGMGVAIGGSGGTEQGGASGGTGEAGSGGTETPQRRCRTSGSQVVLIGDSYINWITHTFALDMNEVVGEPVRNYAIGGFSMASGGLGLIPPQFDQAIAEDPDILVVVMTGGGNDILIPDILQFPEGGRCKEEATSASIPDCQAIVNLAIDTAVENMDKLVAAGIPDVIYFFYPQVPSTWLASNPNGILEYALPLVQKACDDAYSRTDGKLTCHFLNLQTVFEGHPEYFAENDLHENSVGSAAMAQRIWEIMVDNCIAQPESSGCCIP